MMKLKLSLKNLIKLALLVNLFFFIPVSISYSAAKKIRDYYKEPIDLAIKDISKNEYDINIVTKIAGQTVWIYLPLEDIIERAKKEEIFVERFEVQNILAELKDSTIKIDYAIKEVPETKKSHQIAYTKEAKEKINNVWKVIHRVLFKVKHSYYEGMQFFCFVIADVKNGFEMKQIAYLPDLKKVSYGIIPGNEFHHRTVTEDMNLSFEIIGDYQGSHLDYKETTVEEFIIAQIKQRVRQKFARPEVQANINIDEEVKKTIAYVLKIYDFKDFSDAEFNNTLTNKTQVLGKTLLWQGLVN